MIKAFKICSDEDVLTWNGMLMAWVVRISTVVQHSKVVWMKQSKYLKDKKKRKKEQIRYKCVHWV